MEGKIPLDPLYIKILDEGGKNIFDCLPRPDEITQVLCNDENFLMFCASAITTGIMEEKEKNHWKLSVEYKREMKQFGDYALMFSSDEFCKKIEMEKKIHIPQFQCDTGIVEYRDLSDFYSHEMFGGNMRNMPEENALKSSCMEKEKACLPKLDTRLRHILFF